MQYQLKAEQFTQFLITALVLHFHTLQVAWYWWPLLFLSPDISMLGYLVNTKVGAWTYNLVHNKVAAGVLLVIGYLLHRDVLSFLGLLLWCHAAFDRVMGYGLKYPDSFGHTHLGWIGKAANQGGLK